MRRFLPKNAKLVPKDAQCIFKGIIFDTYQWQQKMYDGTFSTFEMLKRPDTISVIAVKNDMIVVLNQEQPGSKKFYDLPGGRHDVSAEDELDAAKRELLEETGMAFNTWRLVRVEQPQSKIEWFSYTFLATDFDNQINQDLDSGEKIDIEFMTLEEIRELKKTPKARYLAESVLGKINSLEELLSLPAVDAN